MILIVRLIHIVDKGVEMIKKRYIKSRKVGKLTFEVKGEELPTGLNVKSVHLVGDFNGWSQTATPMKKVKGVYKAVIEANPGQEIQFRYLANGDVWFNDWDADDYQAGEHGEDNSVVKSPTGYDT
jgi:hypothetical protein